MKRSTTDNLSADGPVWESPDPPQTTRAVQDEAPFQETSAPIPADASFSVPEESSRRDPAAKVATMTQREPSDEPSMADLVRSIADDARLLMRKEVELARHEIVEAAVARAKAAVALSVAGVMGLLAFVFAATAGAWALFNVVPPWVGWLIVSAVLGGMALLGAAFGVRKLRTPSLAPEETKRTLKEDIEWAKTRLTR